MDLSDLASVISKIVMYDKGEIIVASVESQDLAVIVKELFLGVDAAPTELLLHKLLQVIGRLHFRLCQLAAGAQEVVIWAHLSLRLRLLLNFEELTRVFIAVVDADLLPQDNYVRADAEIGRQKCEARAILSQELSPLQEFALGHTTVGLSRLADHDGVVF